jgi:hypothetical protein
MRIYVCFRGKSGRRIAQLAHPEEVAAIFAENFCLWLISKLAKFLAVSKYT